MKMRAKCWVRYGDKWRSAGTEFDVSESEVAGMSAVADVVSLPLPSEPDPDPAPTAKRKGGRPKKKAE